MKLKIEFGDNNTTCHIHIGTFATLTYRDAANLQGALAGAANCLSMNLEYIGGELTHLVDHYGNRHPVSFVT